jgi:hypothetical protein
MASYFGTDTGYSSIANNYLYLQVTDCDKIYNYDITTQQLRQNGISENLYENGSVLADLTMRNNNCLNNLEQAYTQTPESSKVTTIYDLLSLYPELSECKKLVDSCNFERELSQKGGPHKYCTFFAFTNENAGLASIWLKRFNTLGYQRELLKAHTCNFVAEPILFKGKKTKIFTRSEGNELYVDGQAIPMYFYSDAKELNGVTYSPPMLKINIHSFLTCDNGALYIIDRPFYPRIIL